MFSTRKLHFISLAAVVASASPLMSGCGFQRTRNEVVVDHVKDTPLVVDEAMQKRNFERSSAYYQRPTVVAGPTWLTFRGDDEAEYSDLVTEPMIFGANVLASPYQMVTNPQWEAVEYRGQTVPPTHHAMPPLPE